MLFKVTIIIKDKLSKIFILEGCVKLTALWIDQYTQEADLSFKNVSDLKSRAVVPKLSKPRDPYSWRYWLRDYLCKAMSWSQKGGRCCLCSWRQKQTFGILSWDRKFFTNDPKEPEALIKIWSESWVKISLH